MTIRPSDNQGKIPLTSSSNERNPSEPESIAQAKQNLQTCLTDLMKTLSSSTMPSQAHLDKLKKALDSYNNFNPRLPSPLDPSFNSTTTHALDTLRNIIGDESFQGTFFNAVAQRDMGKAKFLLETALLNTSKLQEEASPGYLPPGPASGPLKPK